MARKINLSNSARLQRSPTFLMASMERHTKDGELESVLVAKDGHSL